jgi:hypothetical protein
MKLRYVLIPLGALVLIGAVVFAIVGLPPTLADDYEEKAEPAHQEVEDALRPVTDSFNADTLGVLEIKRTKDSRTYMRRADKATARDLKELSAARREVKRARRAIEEADTGAMTDSPSPPLVGGIGDLGEAADVADAEDAYLRKSRTFLRDYDRMLAFSAASIEAIHEMDIAFTSQDAKIPDTPTSAGQITGPLNRGIAAAARHVKTFGRLKAPRVFRREHRRVHAELEEFLSQQRAISRAITRDDFGRVRQIEREVRADGKRYDRASRKDLDKLLERSPYRRQIDDLERRETKIAQMYEDL